MTYERLAWDTEFFGFRVGRVLGTGTDAEFADSLAAAEQDGAQCLYLLLAVNEVASMHRAIAHGFRPVDVRVSLDLHLEASTHGQPDGVRAARLDDIHALERLARQTFVGTRFSADRRFPSQRVSAMYAAWARRGLLETPPHCALITVDGVSGFIVGRLDRERHTASVELIAVRRERHGAGLGGALLDAAHFTFVNAGCTRAEVVTQARNRAALRLYEGRGYRIDEVGVWLHRWTVGRAATR